MEAWALWHVPNASFIKISPKEASSLANELSFFSSSLWNLRFSRSITSPGLILFTASLTSLPTQSLSFLTSLPSSSFRRSRTGSSRIRSFASPLGLPRWLISITEPPLSRACFIVGMEDFIRVSSVIFKSASKGTLKSALMSIFLPFKSKSLIDFFFNAKSPLYNPFLAIYSIKSITRQE